MKNTIKEVLIYMSNPAFVLSIAVGVLIIVTVLDKNKPVQFSPKYVIGSKLTTDYKSGTIFSKYCIYTFSDGTTFKKYLFDVDISKPNYEDLDYKAYKECT